MDWLGRYLLLISFSVLVSTTVVSKTKKHIRHSYVRPIRADDQQCDLICPGQPVLPLPPNFLRNCTSVNGHTTTTAQTTILEATTTEEPEESTETEAQNSTERHHGRHNRHHKENRKTHTLRKRLAFINKAAKQKLFRQHKQLQNRVRLDGCYVICSDPIYGPGGIPTEPEEPGEVPGGDNYVEGEDNPIQIIYVPTSAEEDKRPHQIYNNYDFPPYFESQPNFGDGFQNWEDKKQKRKPTEKQH